ncbi:MAG TPA: glycosyltransferase [Flavobacteriia bacterium]|nr:glycosyltransferase [Flavobacteriia bacterium]
MYQRTIYWKYLVKYLKKKGLENQTFIGPEVLLYEFPLVFPYQILKDIRLSDYDFEYIVLNKKQKYDLSKEFLDLIQKNYKPIWGNHSFVVYKKNRTKKEAIVALKYKLFTNINFEKYYKPLPEGKTGILITTYNRPEALIKLLNQLKDRAEEILIINDGSDERFIRQYSQIKEQFPKFTYMDNPKNMGLVFSMNTGFSYFLSDPEVHWIHYIQDDVIIEDNAFFEKTRQIADKDKYPVVTGIYREPHKIFNKSTINGQEVYLLRSIPAQHFLVHRLYLSENMPIPNPYVGAPKPDKGKPGQGADEDWWLFSWSPKSIVKRGGYVVSIPNLCSTDMNPDLSTWETN